MKDKKPIMVVEEQENGYTYKYTRVCYVYGIPLKVKTDLTQTDFEKYIDYGFTAEEIERFELTGKF
jgi:hypothetical protein